VFAGAVGENCRGDREGVAMNESEWLACEGPRRMLKFLQGRVSHRKLRLFAVAYCRRIWDLLPDHRCRRAVQLAEAFAEGKGGIRRLRRVENASGPYYDHREDVPAERMGYFTGGAIFQLGQDPLASDIVADAASGAMAWSAPDTGGDRVAVEAAKRIESVVQCLLLRCIVGNPFRPVSPGLWITPAAVTVARDIYDRRDFAALPLLADLLEEAGCPEQSVLDHCRRPGKHARGCWVVDLVLGKS
jgi:hypothetical protein